MSTAQKVQKAGAIMAEQRFRNFLTELYPDENGNVNVEWIDNLHVPAFLSPIHNADTFKDGTFKKPHYHLLLMFEGKKSLEQVRELLLPVGAVGLEVCQSIRGSARYLCHLDNPEKAQYSCGLVRSFAGADYSEVILSEYDKVKLVQTIFRFIDDHNIDYYPDLMRALEKEKDYNLYRTAAFSAVYSINVYLKSKVDKKRNIRKELEDYRK